MMKRFILGVILGSTLTAGFGLAASTLYNPSGAPSAPTGSVQEFDYFRQRQLFLDAGAIRRGVDSNRLKEQRESFAKPCK